MDILHLIGDFFSAESLRAQDLDRPHLDLGPFVDHKRQIQYIGFRLKMAFITNLNGSETFIQVKAANGVQVPAHFGRVKRRLGSRLNGVEELGSSPFTVPFKGDRPYLRPLHHRKGQDDLIGVRPGGGVRLNVLKIAHGEKLVNVIPHLTQGKGIPFFFA